jgi:hypothetical protein
MKTLLLIKRTMTIISIITMIEPKAKKKLKGRFQEPTKAKIQRIAITSPKELFNNTKKRNNILKIDFNSMALFLIMIAKKALWVKEQLLCEMLVATID